MHNSHDPKVLPMRDGVSPSCVVLPSKGDGTVLEFLAQRLPVVTEADWRRRMEGGDVVDEHGVPVRPHDDLRPGLRVYYYREVPVEPEIPFEARVLYQDRHLVVADKPHFLPVVPGGVYLQNSLLVRLKNQLQLPDLSPIHRIDRETAGLVVFAVRREDRGAYQALFRDRVVHKTYEAVAPWREGLVFPRTHRSRLEPSGDFIRMHEAEGAPNSETQMEVLEHNGHWARYALAPVSGKRHQLRVHMMALGLPLRGDSLYPVAAPFAPQDFSQPLQLLARSLCFADPLTGQERSFRSQLQLQPLPGVA